MNIGFIGCGVISIAHLEGLEELKKANQQTFELTAVCELNEDRANTFARMLKNGRANDRQCIRNCSFCR